MKKAKSHQKARYLLILSLFVLVVSCDADFIKEEVNKPGVTQDESNPVCMEPFFVDSLPYGYKAEELTNFTGDINPVTPKVGWERAAGIPTPYPDEIELLFSRKQNDQDELWMAFKVGGETQVRAYLRETDKWETKFEVENYKFIFLDYQNKIWVITSYPIALNNIDFRIYEYDEEQNKLKPKLTGQSVFSEGQVYRFAPSIDGTVWFYLDQANNVNDILVQYDTETNQVIHREEVGLLVSLGVDNQGRLFTASFDDVIRRYDPTTGESSDMKIPSDFQTMYFWDIGFLFPDDQKVWFSDKVWFANDEYLTNLHTLFRSTIFINTYHDPGQPVRWERPQVLTFTDDGRIWYRSSRGLTWHQPETGEWCMFTTAQSNIVKDSEENLWIIYDSSLYMLPASETKARDN